ncbi:hypothetical protein DFH06DRAFT_1386164 [Mycena polygramma]|nr:hypothetical protein DFH06DRAFT_1386164 [Mycena polygramma]
MSNRSKQRDGDENNTTIEVRRNLSATITSCLHDALDAKQRLLSQFTTSKLAVSHFKLLVTGTTLATPRLATFPRAQRALPLLCHSPIDSVVESMDNQPSPAVTKTAHRRHAQHGINNYYARQLMPQTPLTSSSSSYDYWWPYPPGGVPATSTTPIPADTLLASPTSAPVLAFSIQSDSALSSASDILSAVSSSFDSLSAMSSSSPAASSSSSASESIISISALPPSSTNVATNSHSKISMLPASNLVYIVPICGVVGLLIGGITAWCVYGCLTRNGHDRRRGRKSYGTLEVGPEYRPPSPPLGEKQEPEEGEWVGDEKHAGENQNENEDNVEENNNGEASDDDDERGTETQGFLHPGSAQTRPARSSLRTKSSESAATSFYSAAPTTKSTRDPSPTPSGRTSLFFDRPDPSDALPWESLRHKSIKRGILERLRFDAPKGPGQNRDMDMDTADGIARRPQWQAHGRHDSDLLVKDAQAAADLSRASSLWLSRASSAVTASTKPGFRIMQESPAGTPQGERGADVFRWPSVRGEGAGAGAGDKYTRVPERVARSRSRSPEKASPTKYERGGSPDKLARAASPPVRHGGRGRKAQMDDTETDMDTDTADYRTVLPQSPPRISSPVLDDALCFASPIPQSPEPNPGMGMASFASFGAPTADEEWLMKRRAGERALRGGERERRGRDM